MDDRPPRNNLGHARGDTGAGGAAATRLEAILLCLSRLGVWSHREARARLLILPIGSLEDRPKGPAQLDTLLALHISCLIAQRCSGLIAWPLGYGYSPLHRRWAGPRSPRLLEKLLRDTLEGLKTLEPEELLVVDGHYGHQSHTAAAAAKAGAAYVNAWSLLEALGVQGWGNQLRFEEEYAAELNSPPSWPGEAASLAEKAAAALASSLCSPGREGNKF